jgi:hypothetical protein
VEQYTQDNLDFLEVEMLYKCDDVSAQEVDYTLLDEHCPDAYAFQIDVWVLILEPPHLIVEAAAASLIIEKYLKTNKKRKCLEMDYQNLSLSQI